MKGYGWVERRGGLALVEKAVHCVAIFPGTGVAMVILREILPLTARRQRREDGGRVIEGGILVLWNRQSWSGQRGFHVFGTAILRDQVASDVAFLGDFVIDRLGRECSALEKMTIGDVERAYSMNMSMITVVLEPAPDGTLHLPIPDGFKTGKVKVTAHLEFLEPQQESNNIPAIGRDFVRIRQEILGLDLEKRRLLPEDSAFIRDRGER